MTILKKLLTLKKNFYVIGIDSEVHGSGAYICDEFYLSPKGTDIRFLNLFVFTYLNKTNM